MSFSLRREIIPEDILMEVLLRLPADSLMRFKRDSKHWSSLISSSELFSSSATSSVLQLNLDPTLLGNRMQNGDDFGFSDLHFVNAMRDLMCFRDDERAVRIINFTTRQVLILPQVESKMKSDDELVSPSMWNYLGYDPVNDEYKVLSIISSTKNNEVRSETQVFVLGDGAASWRNTKSLTPPHDPTEGISINGVLYYGARFYDERSVLMSFDFSSEEYNLIEVPLEVPRIMWDKTNVNPLVNLMNYQDQIAVLDSLRLKTECVIELWVLEAARQSKWSRKVFVLPCHQLRMTLNTLNFVIRGTGRSGEIALCSGSGDGREIKYIFYDLERNRITI